MHPPKKPPFKVLEEADRRRHADLRDLFGSTEPQPSVVSPPTLGHFEIIRKLGLGSSGAVFLARDIRTGILVALKVLRAYADPDSKQRFRREAFCGLTIKHPNVVGIHKILRRQKFDFIVMEYVRGKALDRLIPPRGLTIGVFCDYALQMAAALGALHARGMLHRDIKPANFVVKKHGVVKLLDFGLAKPVEGTGCESCNLPDDAFVETRQGTILGTVNYMSPEQVRGQAADQRSDVFGLGALFYEMLIGRRPFQEATAVETLNAILCRTPLPLPARVPAKLAAIVRRCLQKNPARRYRTANDLADALAAFSDSYHGPHQLLCG